MALDLEKTKSDLRNHIGNVVDQDNMQHLFKYYILKHKIRFLFECILLSKIYPKIHEYIKELIENINSIELNKKSLKNKTILSLIMQKFADRVSLQSIQILIDHGADVNLVSYRETPLFVLIKNYDNKHHDSYVNLMKLLIDNGADINFKFTFYYKHPESALMNFFSSHAYKHWNFANIMLDFGATLDVTDLESLPPTSRQRIIEMIENRKGRMTKPAIK